MIFAQWQKGKNMRLIDADALIKTLGIDDLPIRLTYEIENAPTVDAVPVRHGKWIDDGQHADFFPHHEWRCSECGEQVLEIGEPWYVYCPNCGADMRGDRD